MLQQTITIVGGLLGLVILYFIGQIAFALMLPETYEKIQRNFVLKNIQHYFEFLFEKGYKIRETKYGHKYIKLESKDCVISIIKDRGEILVSFSPVFGSDDDYNNNQIGLEAMMYYLSQGKNYISYAERTRVKSEKEQYKRLANLLKEHTDKIASYFGHAYFEYRDELKKAEKTYFDCMLTEIGSKRKN
jgi:hypothetical protein